LTQGLPGQSAPDICGEKLRDDNLTITPFTMKNVPWNDVDFACVQSIVVLILIAVSNPT
jgi:hypothetical protein